MDSLKCLSTQGDAAGCEVVISECLVPGTGAPRMDQPGLLQGLQRHLGACVWATAKA